MTREQILKTTDKWIAEVLFCPVDKEGFPLKKMVPEQKVDWDSQMQHLAILRGIPEWYVPEWKRKVLKRQGR